jgi:hypothetical protein
MDGECNTYASEEDRVQDTGGKAGMKDTTRKTKI